MRFVLVFRWCQAGGGGSSRFVLPFYSRNPSLRSPEARRTWGYNFGRPILALNKDILGPEAGCSPGKVILVPMNKIFYPLKRKNIKQSRQDYCLKERRKRPQKITPKTNIIMNTQIFKLIKKWTNLIQMITNYIKNTHK